MRVESWAFAPGQSVSPIDVAVPAGTRGTVLFANYASPGQHRAVLPSGGTVAILFDEEDFTVTSK